MFITAVHQRCAYGERSGELFRLDDGGIRIVRGVLEAAAMLSIVVVLAGLVLVSIISASLLADSSTAALDRIDAVDPDNTLTADDWSPCAMLQETPCR